MPATTDTVENVSRTIIACRAPESLDRELKALATREGNPLSATVRRLIRVGLDNECRTLLKAVASDLRPVHTLAHARGRSGTSTPW